MQRIRKATARLVATLLGIVAVVAIAELVLTCVALARRSCARGGGGAQTIVCLGDSFTYGPRVSRDESYPAQLERLLNKGTSGEWQVINAGMPAYNSTQARMYLEKILWGERPGIVTVLIGWANHWNWRGYASTMGDAAHMRSRGWQQRLTSFLQGSRAFVLGQLLVAKAREAYEQRRATVCARKALTPGRRREVEELERRFQGAPEETSNALALCAFWLEEEHTAEALEWAARAVASAPTEPAGYIAACEVLLPSLRYLEASHWISNGLQHCPGCPELYNYRIELDLMNGNIEAALSTLSNGLVVAPSYAEFHEQARMIAARYPMHAKAVLWLMADAQLRRIQSRTSGEEHHEEPRRWCRPRSRMLKTQEQLAWVKQDVETVVARCAQAGATVILQTYPICNDGHVRPCRPESLAYYRALNNLLRYLAREHGVWLADHDHMFSALSNRTTFFLYGADEHPNAAGYALMASNVHAVITRENLRVARR